MKEELVKYKTALLAKEKRFNIECEKYYNVQGELWTYHLWGVGLSEGACFRPTQSLLQKWLREKHKIYVNVLAYENLNSIKIIGEDIPNKMALTYSSYEETLENGLKEALGYIK